MRHGFGATTYTCSASGCWARTACAPRPTRTIRPCAAASAITRPVSGTIAACSGSTRGTPAVAMNISGDPAARVRARRSNSPGARSSRWATASGGSPARRATSSTNSLSITSHPSSAATRRATSEPPEAYCRVIVMTGGAISGLQVLAQVADVEKRQPALGGDEDDQVARALHVVQHFDPLLGERFGGERLVEEPLLLGLEAGDLDPVALRLDLLLLRDLVVDRLHHLGRGLQVTEKEGRHRRDPEVPAAGAGRSEEHTSELQSQSNLVCRLLLEKKKQRAKTHKTASPTIASPQCMSHTHQAVGRHMPAGAAYHPSFFFFNDTATTEIYTLSLHDALPIFDRLHHLGRGLQVTEKEGRHRRDPEVPAAGAGPRHEGGVDQPLHRVRDLGALGDVVDRVLHHAVAQDRKSTRLNSSHSQISYAVFCL